MPRSDVSREQLAAALYALVDFAANKAINLRSSSRRLVLFDQVDPSAMPALFQIQRPETNERTVEGLPSKRTMHFELWLYTADNQDVDTVPSQQLNIMVDAIERALKPDATTGKLTLNGLCSHCWIEGAIEYYEGLTIDGKSVAMIPVAILMP